MGERILIDVEGVVQGVGFRPFVHQLATNLHLTGLVRNARGGVSIDVEGDPANLRSFLEQLKRSAPPLATIENVAIAPAPPTSREGFTIVASDVAGTATPLCGDVAVCDACVAELFDRTNRRYRYPFVTCAWCGPRFTIAEALPYDRERTTMAAFAMCGECRGEYEDPRDRRFHAQAIACPACGPSLTLRTTGSGTPSAGYGAAALEGAAALLRSGSIVAVKGIGGYHLACDAANDEAVRRLRHRKGRQDKPFAVMVRDLALAERLCHVDAAARPLLRSPQRPIVLLDSRDNGALSRHVAPGGRLLGVMLPYAPLHHLLLADGRGALVMTSGNLTDEPIAIDDEDALERLGGVADAILSHDRRIAARCDDSVVRPMRPVPALIRRSRGYAPQPLPLARPLPHPVLATGAHLKNAFCLGSGRRAFLSPHVGDLENVDAYRALKESIAHYERLFEIRPEIVAHDLHPQYLSTAVARELERRTAIAVQHHHAHAAACVAEHGLEGPVLAVVFNGAGLGEDGAVWGGEFLVVEDGTYRRAGHLAYVPQPGGDAAARQPWRMAAAYLWTAYGSGIDSVDIPSRQDWPSRQWPLLRQMLQRRVQSPPTSSAGRLFDAVASIVGVRQLATFEGQAALELEALADPDEAGSYGFDLAETFGQVIVDPSEMIRGIVRDVSRGRSAPEVVAAFHNTLCDIIVRTAQRVCKGDGLRHVVLTGGVFQNARLTATAASALEAAGLNVRLHERVPCNDGGLALGQAWVAAHRAGG